MPHCSEVWDAIAQYIYAGLQGGSIMKGWLKEEHTMIDCCFDGTRSVGSREKVDILTQRLKEDGYEIVSGPRTTGDGYYESCIVGIEGNQIEITV